MSSQTLASFKAQFHQDRRMIHMNHAGQSLLSRPAREKLEFCAKLFFEEGAFSWLKLPAELEKAKKSLVNFLGADPKELAYFQTTSGAISQIAFGFSLKAGDEILLWDQEYPSNHYPWGVAAQRAGAKLILVPSEPDLSTPVEKILERITPRTKIVATSWVQFRSGAVLDLKALTKETRTRGIFTCADIIQGAGVRPFNFKDSGLDAACGGSHKWMMGAHGAGYLLLREEWIGKIAPLMVGATTFGTTEEPVDLTRPLQPDATRFEPGGKAFAEIIALGASAELIHQTGIETIAAEADRLCLRLKTGLEGIGYRINSPHGAHFSGAILNVSPTGSSPLKDLAQMEKQLSSAQVSFAKRPPGLRLSPHAMLLDAEIDRVLEVLSR